MTRLLGVVGEECITVLFHAAVLATFIDPPSAIHNTPTMDINYLAVIVSALIPMFIGFFWYGSLFGKKWMELMGTTKEEVQAAFNPIKNFGGTLVASFLTAFVLAHILDAFGEAFGATGWLAGVQGGFWC